MINTTVRSGQFYIPLPIQKYELNMAVSKYQHSAVHGKYVNFISV